MANTFLHLNKSWHEVKERIKEQNSELTDEDLDLKPGKENELLERLQSKLQMGARDVKRWIESISDNEAQAG